MGKGIATLTANWINSTYNLLLQGLLNWCPTLHMRVPSLKSVLLVVCIAYIMGQQVQLHDSSTRQAALLEKIKSELSRILDELNDINREKLTQFLTSNQGKVLDQQILGKIQEDMSAGLNSTNKVLKNLTLLLSSCESKFLEQLDTTNKKQDTLLDKINNVIPAWLNKIENSVSSQLNKTESTRLSNELQKLALLLNSSILDNSSKKQGEELFDRIERAISAQLNKTEKGMSTQLSKAFQKLAHLMNSKERFKLYHS